MRFVLVLSALLVSCARTEAPVERGPALFSDVTQESGLNFTHSNGASGEFYMPEIMGAGVALLDYDGDGDLDVFLVQSEGEGKLFRNELIPGGTLRFVDVTTESGISYKGYGMGAATGDIDGDGRPDLLITGWGETELYRNTGGKFELVPMEFPDVWSTSAAFFDYDRDNRADLVILSYVNFSEAINKKCQAPTGETDYCTPRAYSPVSARLYHNDGGGKFTEVTAKSGINRAQGPGLGVATLDLNEDGWQDLFIANDTAQNHVWINQKDGTFRELGIESGAGYSEDGLAKAGMGVAAGDYDGDGDFDLFVVNLMREGATLFRNEGVSPQGWPMFLDVTRSSGLYQLTFPFTGFGTDWIDFDNDGVLDLFIANGAVTLREEQRGKPEPFKERNLLLRNFGNGKFADLSAQGGPVFDLLEITRGAAFGDLDNDGDIDIVITNNNGPARVLRNDSPRSGFLLVDARAPQPLGAVITLYREDLMPLVRRVHTDSSYCSASDARVHFGLGDKALVGSLEILWPDGRRESWADVPANGVFAAKYGTGKAIP
jgi:predicted nucleotidyltransferase